MTTDARCLVEASAWKTHLTETGQESTAAFEAWLNAAQDNRRAWSRVQESWDLFGEHATAPEVLDLRRKALKQARETGSRRWSGQCFVGRWRHVGWAAGVAVVLAVSFVAWNAQKPDVYRTDAGERRVMTLPDGSQVHLDAHTELRVKYSERARDLMLIKGQARFDVAQDVERPFGVRAAGRKVVAIGTAFNVDLLGRELFVTLIEGRVAVLQTGAPAAESVELSAGQQFMVAAGGEPKVVAANLQRATAWQSGQLIFDDEPLSAVIARMNRYSHKPLTVSEGAATLKLSGVFNAGDIDGFVVTLTRYLPVRAHTHADSIEIESDF